MDSTASPSQNDRTHQRRIVNRLSSGQLALKRAGDRICQQKIRKRNQNYLMALEQRIAELEERNVELQEQMKRVVGTNEDSNVTQPNSLRALYSKKAGNPRRPCCDGCRSRKIKCERRAERIKCSYCHKRGFSCSFEDE